MDLRQQVSMIYCALHAQAMEPEDQPTCICVEGYGLQETIGAIYCLLYSQIESEDLEPCACVTGGPIGDALDAIYCVLYIRSGSPESLDSCECVRWLTIFEKLDAIYCVLRYESGDESLPSCDCVAGLPLQDKLSAIFEAVITPAEPVGGASLIVSWEDNSGIEDGFRVEISIDGVIYSTAGITPANVTTFTIEHLEFNTLYWVRVYAFNEFGDSPVLGPAMVYTEPEFGPTNLIATAVSSSEIDLQWDLASVAPVTGYKIYYRADGAPSYLVYDTTGPADTDTQVAGLDSSTTYEFYVVAYNENAPQVDGESPPSNIATAVTNPVLNSASVDTTGFLLSLVFSEPVDFGVGGNGGVTVAPTGGASTATYTSGSGTSTLIYTLSRRIAAVETLTTTYVQPGNGIQSVSGDGDVASYAAYAVTNNSTYVAYLISEDFSGTGQPAGFTLTSGTFNWDAVDWPGGVPAGLTQSVKFTANNQIGYWPFTAQANVYCFIAFYITSPTAVNLVPFRIMDAAGAALCAATFRSDLQIQLTVGSSSTGGAYLQGQTYFLWLEYEKGTGANAHGRVYLSTTQTKPGAPTRNLTTGTVTADAGRLKFDPGATGTMWVTKLRVSSTIIGSNPT